MTRPPPARSRTGPGRRPDAGPQAAGALLCTICSKRKRRDPGTMPAIRRYLSRRIRFVHTLSRLQEAPMRILSGRFGLLRPGDALPWYDHALASADVERLAPLVADQLAATGARRVAFYARPRSTPGWTPYYQLLERVCHQRHIPLQVVHLSRQFP